MKKDKIFLRPRTTMNFCNPDTVRVFDDMLVRSVPLYKELQRMIVELSLHFARSGTRVYDLGCSTGLTLGQLAKSSDKRIHYIGIDYSFPMLKQCKRTLQRNTASSRIKLVCWDLNKPLPIHNASVVILNLTLQFLKPKNRLLLLRSIHRGLADGGCVILAEKVRNDYKRFDDLFTQRYYQMKKRNKYSKGEIRHKEKALKGFLQPFTAQANEQLLASSGFSQCETFYRWYNFHGMLAMK